MQPLRNVLTLYLLKMTPPQGLLMLHTALHRSSTPMPPPMTATATTAPSTFSFLSILPLGNRGTMSTRLVYLHTSPPCIFVFALRPFFSCPSSISTTDTNAERFICSLISSIFAGTTALLADAVQGEGWWWVGNEVCFWFSRLLSFFLALLSLFFFRFF